MNIQHSTQEEVARPPDVSSADIWQGRLRTIRIKAEATAHAALNISRILYISLLLGVVVWAGNMIIGMRLAYSGSYSPEELSGLLIAIVVLGGLVAGLISMLIRDGKQFRKTYDKYSEVFATTDLARVFVDEELHTILQSKLDKAALFGAGKVRKSRSFEKQLDYCACHMISLRRLAANPEAKVLYTDLRRAAAALSFPRQSALGSGLLPLTCLGMVILPSVVFFFVLYLSLRAGVTIDSQAVLAALVDFVLEARRPPGL